MGFNAKRVPNEFSKEMRFSFAFFLVSVMRLNFHLIVMFNKGVVAMETSHKILIAFRFDA